MDIAINIGLIAAALVLTVLLLKKEVNLGLIMLLDAVFVAVIVRMPAAEAFEFAYKGAFSMSTIRLIIVFFLIMMLENIMRNTGMIESMVSSLKSLAGGNRLAAGLLPMVVGLLPSPGGARFSCPMVEEVARDNTDPQNKAFINYWFRHVWMDAFILYPGIILAAELLHVSVISLFLYMIPFIVFNVLYGSIFGLARMKKEKIQRTEPVKENVKTLLLSVYPIVIVITAYLSLLKVTPYSLEIASGGMVVALLIIKKMPVKKIMAAVREAFPVKLVLIIIGVMVFKEILLGSKALDGLPGLMESYGIPAALLFILLPILGSVTSGITVSFVSLSFPILIPLGLGNNLWFASASFAAGFIGNMITPLHLCAVMTADYFKSPLGKLLRKVALAEIPLFAAVVIIILVVKI